jgi:riboflavin kinase/FMN adenylyltransferase
LEIIKGIENFKPSDGEVVATIGTFDGVHLGHREILRRLMESAGHAGRGALAVTFEPHPRVLVTPQDPPPLLSTWDEKVHLFSSCMDGHLLVLNFNEKLMNLSAEEFVKGYLINKLNLKKLIVGYDHAFGKNRSGTINDLMRLSQLYKFELEVVKPIIVNGCPISSTRIRRLIIDGKYEQALKMLGHPYPIAGKVIRGIDLGKKLGYPTANIDYNPRKLLPPDGVYYCRIEHGGRQYDGMMFIGKNHFNPDIEKSVEVNIYNFDKEIYNESIVCYPKIFIRENRKFKNTAELAEQIGRDKESVMKIINKGDDINVN